MQIPVAIGVVGGEGQVLGQLVGRPRLEVVHVVGHVGVAIAGGELDGADVVAQAHLSVEAAALLAGQGIPTGVVHVGGQLPFQAVAHQAGFTVEVQAGAEGGVDTHPQAGDGHAVVAAAAGGVFAADPAIDIAGEALGEIQAQAAEVAVLPILATDVVRLGVGPGGRALGIAEGILRQDGGGRETGQNQNRQCDLLHFVDSMG